MADPFRYFRIEGRELTDLLTNGVSDLGRGVSAPDSVNALLRWAHTLKGAARVVQLPEVADRAHSLEDILSPYRDATGPVPGDPIAAALRILDEISLRIAAIPSAPDAPRAVRMSGATSRRG